MIESFRTLAAVIAAHPRQEVVGRIRLQKTIRLLQRLGLPTDYLYTIHFYGPYSEDLHSELTLLKNLKMVSETGQAFPNGDAVQYTIKATGSADSSLVNRYQPKINMMASSDPVILELAATYDYYRDQGSDHVTAIKQLRQKKGAKCDGGNEAKALDLLKQLELTSQ
jgi:uncharacterized protein YwgA